MARWHICTALAALTLATGAAAQDVAVTALAAPDHFSTGGRDTGLPQSLWLGASPDTMRAVIGVLAAKPLGPAGRGLAARVLATGAPAPPEFARDEAIAGQRINALIAQGAVAEAGAILERSSTLDRSPELAQAAAEAALLAGDVERACTTAARLSTGRDEIYWLRLRAFCQAQRGESGPAQLTFDLAQGQARDPIYGRLMGAKLGLAAAGAPSLRNGLDYALSRDLGLDLSQVKASAAVSAALERRVAPVAPADAALADAISLARAGQPDAATLDRLISRAASAEGKARPKAQNAALIFAALGAPISPSSRAALATFTGADARGSQSKLLALDLAVDAKLVGETALLVLWVTADAGASGPPTGDRVRLIRALKAVGLDEDARSYAVEGLAAQQ